jgi:hypothetical protein
MSRAVELQLTGLPAGVIQFVAAFRLADDAARAVVDFVRGARADLPGGFAALSVQIENWRGAFLGGLASKRDICPFEPCKPEIDRLRGSYGDLNAPPARAFLEAFTRAAERGC